MTSKRAFGLFGCPAKTRTTYPEFDYDPALREVGL